MTNNQVHTIGLIGAGHIGGQVARLAIANGYDVVISNSRGPETLSELVGELGPNASAATTEEAAAAGDLVVVTVPLKAIDSLPVEPLAGKTVIDTNNYYPQRDGNMAELDDKSQTSAGLLQQRLAESHVIKAFNHIRYDQLISDATPAGTDNRRALAIAGDDDVAKAQVSSLLDQFGFDTVDIGTLSQSWRIEPGSPGYGPQLNATQMKAALEAASRTAA
jgi:predicted dinucleotide-binding enzyme